MTAGRGWRVDAVAADDPRLARFHAGIYDDAFAAQLEPLAAWQAALRGERPYELTVQLAEQGGALAGGIAFERYPRSGCGLVTYLVVAAGARRQGLGAALLRGAVEALHARGAPIVLGEVHDPARGGDPARLARFVRWGARVLEARYVQPALGPGLARDRALVLIALPGAAGLPACTPGGPVRAFVEELYAVTEGGPVDPEVHVPDPVLLR